MFSEYQVAAANPAKRLNHLKLYIHEDIYMPNLFFLKLHTLFEVDAGQQVLNSGFPEFQLITHSLLKCNREPDQVFLFLNTNRLTLNMQ